MNKFTEFLVNNKIEFIQNEPMKNHTSFKIGGVADYFIVPKSIEECKIAIFACRDNDIDYFLIGKGSNILVKDEGFRGAIICISNNFSEISLINDNEILAFAGASLSTLCNFALANSLTGLEFAYGIPGSVGGAVYMNAGAYGGEISCVIKSCKYIDENGNIVEKNAEELDFSYRHSLFFENDYCIVSAIFRLEKGDPQLIKEKMNDFLKRRKDKQPLDYPSAGSTFKRPQGSYASLLIDECGLKGFSVGGAQVSEKHAGFIINKDNATANDVITLMKNVEEIVFEKTGYTLEAEIKII